MTATKQAIHPGGRNTAIAPYSPAIAVGDLVFVSGQGPLDTRTMTFVCGDIEQQTALTLDNLKAVLDEAGCDLADVVKVAVHLQNINDFQRFNKVYAHYFHPPHPARTTVQSILAAGISVEIDAVAVRGCGGNTPRASRNEGPS